MFEGTKRTRAPYWIPPLDILKLLGLFACLGLSLLRGCAGPTAAPLTLDAKAKQIVVGTRGEVFGTATKGSTVNLYQGDQYLGNTVARDDGTWNYALPALAAGTYAITARTDNSGIAVPLSVEVMAAPPVAATEAQKPAEQKLLPASAPVIVSPAGGTNLPLNNLGNVEGAANAGNLVALYEGDKKIGEATTGANGRWLVPLAGLAIGPHDLFAKATGGDGKEVASLPVHVNVVAAVAAPAPTATAETKAAAVAPTATTVAVAPAPTATAEAKAAAVAPTATAEAAKPEATATSAPAAVAATPTVAAVAAVEPPAISSPADGAKLPIANLGSVSGVAAASSKVEVSVNGKPIGEVDAAKDGKWSIALAGLKPGEYTLSAKDANGASNEAKVVVVAAPVAPVITNIKSGSKVTAGKVVEVAGTGPANSTITVYENAAEVGKTQSDAKGAWKLTPTKAIDPGKYKITAIASDAVAGESAKSNTVDIEAGVTVLLPTTGGDLSGN